MDMLVISQFNNSSSSSSQEKINSRNKIGKSSLI